MFRVRQRQLACEASKRFDVCTEIDGMNGATNVWTRLFCEPCCQVQILGPEAIRLSTLQEVTKQC
jgi:hypothetical protein